MQDIKGKLSVSVPRSIIYLGSIYHSPFEALMELLENGLDAGATRLFVELSQDRITVIDNGHGMIPDLTVEDNDMVELIKEEDRDYSPEDLRSLVSSISRKSLKWMMEFGALSAKIPGEGEGIRGLRGIGTMAVRQIADKAVWYSRANEDIARQYWGESYRKKDIPTFELHPPTTEQLRKGERGYVINQSTTPLRDHKNVPMQNGTRVDLTSLKPEIINQIRPATLVDHLRSRFDEDLRTHRIEIIVIDRVTDDGRKSLGKEIYVTPATIHEIPVLTGEFSLRPGIIFKAELYYNPNSKSGYRPQLRRKGSNVNDLTNVSQLNKQPLNGGKISGFIQFPDVPEEKAPWTTDKHLPDTSSIQQAWINKILQLIEEVIEPKIAEIEQRNRSRELNLLAADAAQAVLQAMQEIDIFKDVKIKSTVPQPPPPKPPAPQTVAVGIQATVFNEHNRGVEDVQIILLRNRKQIAIKRTGKGGSVAFGTVEPGVYTVRLGDIPAGTVPRGHTEYEDFMITLDSPGFRGIFRLYTGVNAPEQRTIHSLDIIFRSFDPGLMYDASNLNKGTVQINSETENWKKAMMAKDEDAKIEHIALCTSAAIAEYSFPKESPSFVLNHQCSLAIKTIENLRQKRATRKRRRS